MISIYNFTKRQTICIGKSGEEPPFAVLKEVAKRFQWDLVNDVIEFVDSSRNEDISFTDEEEEMYFTILGDQFPWKERYNLWNQYAGIKQQILSEEPKPQES